MVAGEIFSKRGLLPGKLFNRLCRKQSAHSAVEPLSLLVQQHFFISWFKGIKSISKGCIKNTPVISILDLPTDPASDQF
jgi:hypothetical protein